MNYDFTSFVAEPDAIRYAEEAAREGRQMIVYHGRDGRFYVAATRAFDALVERWKRWKNTRD